MAERRADPAARLAPHGAVTQLLVPLDGSDASTRALPVAAALGRRLGVPIAVIDLLPPLLPQHGEQAWVEEQVAELGPLVSRHEVIVASDVVEGILEEAAAPGTVLCMASHGRSGVGEALLGSVTRAVVLRSPSPVVVVGPRSAAPVSFDTLQVAYDGSADAASTLDAAADWAHRLGAVPWVTHVVDESGFEDPMVTGEAMFDAVVAAAARHLRQRGLDPEWDVLHGRHVAATLTDWAAHHQVSLLVAGAHPRLLHDRLLGTMTGRLVHLAPCPVLLVGEGDGVVPA